MFLASEVATTMQSILELAENLVVREFSNVLLDEVPGLPPARVVEFVINLVPYTMSISRALYQMAPLELLALSRPTYMSY